jgi:hypothetical protein
MIGSSGTTSRPFTRVIPVPLGGGFTFEDVGIRIRSHHHRGVTRSSQKLWKSVWKSYD